MNTMIAVLKKLFVTLIIGLFAMNALADENLEMEREITSIKLIRSSIHHGILTEGGKLISPPSEKTFSGEQAKNLWKDIRLLLKSEENVFDERLTEKIRKDKEVSMSPPLFEIIVNYKTGSKEEKIMIGESILIDESRAVYRNNSNCKLLHAQLSTLLYKIEPQGEK